jgi:hypothetical protein
MNIDPLNNSGFVRLSLQNDTRSAASARNPDDGGADQLATDFSRHVREALASIPEIRPEIVERGRQLRADPNYPSLEIVTEIARRISPLSEDESGLTD